MDSFQLSQISGRPITAHASTGARVQHFLQGTPLSVTVIHLEPEGLLGLHSAMSDQFFLVISGSGQASDSRGVSCQLSPGTCVIWRKDEEHETTSGKEGLTALVLEGDGLVDTVREHFPW